MSLDNVLAIYPGSFDPLTYGHLDIINRTLKVFPNLVVSVVGNPAKNNLFTFEERKEMLKNVLSDKNNIRIDGFEGLLIDYVKSIGAKVIVRGLRAISDFEYEFQMALSNSKLNKDIETVFMMSSEQYSYVSSRLIKEIAMLGGDVSCFVPEYIALKLSEKFVSDK